MYCTYLDTNYMKNFLVKDLHTPRGPSTTIFRSLKNLGPLSKENVKKMPS